MEGAYRGYLGLHRDYVDLKDITAMVDRITGKENEMQTRGSRAGSRGMLSSQVPYNYGVGNPKPKNVMFVIT